MYGITKTLHLRQLCTRNFELHIYYLEANISRCTVYNLSLLYHVHVHTRRLFWTVTTGHKLSPPSSPALGNDQPIHDPTNQHRINGTVDSANERTRDELKGKPLAVLRRIERVFILRFCKVSCLLHVSFLDSSGVVPYVPVDHDKRQNVPFSLCFLYKLYLQNGG